MGERHHRWYQENKDKVKERRIAYRKELFVKVVDGYGGKCLFCGEDRILALLIHHIDGGGTNQKKLFSDMAGFHRWIIENNFPDDLILLCGTCHLILHRTT